MANSAHSHKHYHIALIILLILVAVIFFKFAARQVKWHSYVVDSQKTAMNYKSADSVEDAGMIAATIVSVPVNDPLINQPAALQSYIQALSKQTGRDIVVIDTNKKILADTIPVNVGTIYVGEESNSNQVSKTIADGQPRDFVEKSADYPNGIAQTVITFKDLNGTPMGAIILSNSKIFNQ